MEFRIASTRWLEGMINMTETLEELRIPLEWYVPDDLESKFATNIVVQRSEYEVVLNFFEIERPLIMIDDTEVTRKQWQSLETIRARCVARVVVSQERMPSFIDAIQRNLGRGKEEAEEGEE
jgi:hypothetical protein